MLHDSGFTLHFLCCPVFPSGLQHPGLCAVGYEEAVMVCESTLILHTVPSLAVFLQQICYHVYSPLSSVGPLQSQSTYRQTTSHTFFKMAFKSIVYPKMDSFLLRIIKTFGYQHSSKYLLLHFTQDSKSFKFGNTWVNDGGLFYFRVDYPFNTFLKTYTNKMNTGCPCRTSPYNLGFFYFITNIGPIFYCKTD